MAQSVFYIKQGDTKPYLRATLQDANGQAVNVSGTTIHFSMRLDFTQPVKATGDVSIIDGPGGIVEYRWGATDTDTAGEYRGEYTVTYADLSTETFPTNGYIKVVIMKAVS